MNSHRWITASAAILCAAGLAVAADVPAVAAEAAPDPLAAVVAATPATVANAATVSTSESGTKALDGTIGATKVTVPTDPAAGISLGAGAEAISIGLPFAEHADSATVEAPGVVSYDNNNGSITVPVVENDGTVQINTVVNDADAPHRYTYPLEVPVGQSLRLNDADGSAYVAGEDGTASALIATPWAKDADGNPVRTHYEVQGNTLTQVVDFTRTTAFPVVADPSVSFGTYVVVTMSQATAKAINTGSAGTAIGLLALAGPVGAIIGAAVYGTVGSYNDSKLSTCKNWSFSYTYLGQLVKAGCA